jgi:hypothetical protein
MLTNTRESNTEGGLLQTDVGPNGDPIHYYPVQTVGGPHNHAATTVHNYVVTMLMLAERDLRRDGALTEESRAMLAMLNVGLIVNDHGRGMGFPERFAAGAEAPPIGRHIEIEAATPAVFAPALFQLEPDPELDRGMVWRSGYLEPPDPKTERLAAFLEQALQAMAYRPEAAAAGRLPVRELPAGALPGANAVADAAAPEPLAVEAYEVTADRVTLAVTAPADGWLQLAHPWYPTMTVTLNGEDIDPVRGAFNLMVVPALAGENLYVIAPHRSLLRIVMGILCALVLLAVLAVPVAGPVLARRRRRGAAAAEPETSAGTTG